MTGHSLVPMAAKAVGHPATRTSACSILEMAPCGITRAAQPARRRPGRARGCCVLRRRAAAAAAALARFPLRERATSTAQLAADHARARSSARRAAACAATSSPSTSAEVRAGLRAAALGAARRPCAASGPTALEVALEEHVALARWGERRAGQYPRRDASAASAATPPAAVRRARRHRGRGDAALRRLQRAARAARHASPSAWCSRRATPGSCALDNGLQLELGRDADQRRGAPRRASSRPTRLDAAACAAQARIRRPALSERLRAARCRS